ncbi:hypothetical protein MKZ38_001801 [Zalerion maritima]|uniref:Uncharacterized protein n=1 Tax=Zalerion maritima TaxID=339359 RepID=A0AAD5S5E7_9PEZI|nr:hypothetical protein MKZ38_001801 [Zalerion maritima]
MSSARRLTARWPSTAGTGDNSSLWAEGSSGGDPFHMEREISVALRRHEEASAAAPAAAGPPSSSRPPPAAPAAGTTTAAAADGASDWVTVASSEAGGGSVAGPGVFVRGVARGPAVRRFASPRLRAGGGLLVGESAVGVEYYPSDDEEDDMSSAAAAPTSLGAEQGSAPVSAAGRETRFSSAGRGFSGVSTPAAFVSSGAVSSGVTGDVDASSLRVEGPTSSYAYGGGESSSRQAVVGSAWSYSSSEGEEGEDSRLRRLGSAMFGRLRQNKQRQNQDQDSISSARANTESSSALPVGYFDDDWAISRRLAKLISRGDTPQPPQAQTRTGAATAKQQQQGHFGPHPDHTATQRPSRAIQSGVFSLLGGSSKRARDLEQGDGGVIGQEDGRFEAVELNENPQHGHFQPRSSMHHHQRQHQNVGGRLGPIPRTVHTVDTEAAVARASNRAVRGSRVCSADFVPRHLAHQHQQQRAQQSQQQGHHGHGREHRANITTERAANGQNQGGQVQASQTPGSIFLRTRTFISTIASPIFGGDEERDNYLDRTDDDNLPAALPPSSTATCDPRLGAPAPAFISLAALQRRRALFRAMYVLGVLSVLPTVLALSCVDRAVVRHFSWGQLNGWNVRQRRHFLVLGTLQLVLVVVAIAFGAWYAGQTGRE